PSGCHVAEVEIDPETGAIELVRYTAVDDYGRLINPLLTEGQVQGGVAQGIGQAMLEHTVYDASSDQLLSGSFMDYALPCAAGILFPVMGGFAKFLGEDGFNSLQVSWARAFGHILFMLGAFVPRFGLGMLRTRRLGTQVLRSALLMTSNLSFFFAIVSIPM